MTAPTLRETGSYAAARIVPAFASMATTLLCIQMLSPREYAVYSLTLLPAAIAAGFAGAATGQALLRYALELQPRDVGRALHGLPALAAMLACVLLLGYFGWRDELGVPALLAISAVPAIVLIDARRAWFIAHGAASKVFALDTWRAALALILTLLLLLGWSAQPAAPLAAGAIAGFAALALVSAAPPPAGQVGTRSIDRAYVAHGLGLAVWLAVILGLSLAERSIVASQLGLTDSGRYAAQADVINALFSAAGGALASAMMPTYLRGAASGDQAAFAKLLRYASSALLALASASLLAAWALWALAPAIGHPQSLVSLTGDPSTGLMLLAAAAVWTIAGFVQKPVEMGGRARHLVYAVLAALLLFLVIAPWGASQHGAAGVAGAKLLAGLCFMGWVAVAGRFR
jgi:O-antigen/teichoic acid export membrane protein